MSRNMDTLFVRAGRPLRLHFDDTRITAVAIRQLSWRVEQGGGAIVEHPSGADVLVVDPAAPWVFQEFLRSKLPELRPSVVLAFWIPLCLTTRSLIWINHPYWQQVVIPSERTPHSEIPRGVTAYSSFLAGIAYSRIAPFSSSKTVSRPSRALDRDSSVISNLDNSDLEVSRSLEPGASSDDEPLEIARKSKRPSPGKTKPRSDSTSAAAPPLRATEVQRDEAEVSEILPETPLSAEDVDMLPPSPLPEPARRPRRVAVVENVAPAPHSRSAEKQPYSAPNLSGTQHHSSPRHSSPQHEPDLSLTHGDPFPDSATVAVEPNASPNSMEPVVQARQSTAPQYVVANSAPPVASETVSATEEPYIPSTLDSTPPPASDEPNGNAAVLDKSTAASEPPNKFEELKRAQKQTFSASGTIEAAGSAATTETSPFTESSQPRASTSAAPPSTPASVPKTSAPPRKSSVSGLKYISDSSSGTQSSKPSPANASKIKVRPKMRPVPQPDGNDPIASSSSPRTSLSHPKSKLNIQSGANGTSTKPRPSVVASTTGVTSLIKPSQSSSAATAAPVGSPASTISSSVTNATGSLPVSATTTPATTVAADTPKPAPGSSLSRPKQLIIRSPTISTTTLSRPNASVSPVQSRHPAPTSGSQPRALSPEAVPPFNSPPPPPTPTPEQLTALAAKRPAWTKEEDQYIIDYMNWVFAQDPLASTSEIMKEIAANCPYRSVGNWQNRFRSKEDSIYMNEVPVLFERLTNKTSGVGSSRSNTKTLEILSGTRTRSRGAVDYVDSSADEDEDSSDDGSGPPRKRTRRSQAGGRRHSNRLG